MARTARDLKDGKNRSLEKKELETDRQTDRDRDRERQRQRQRHRERERDDPLCTESWTVR